MPIGYPQALVAPGDSTTQGSGSCFMAWPYRLRTLCGQGWMAAQYGKGGYTATQINSNFSSNIRTSAGVTKFPNSPKRVLFLLSGVNDVLGVSPNATTIYNLVKIPIDAAVQDNITAPGTWARIYFMTILPCFRYSNDLTKQSVLTTVNASIMAYSGALVTPFDSYTLLGDNSDPRKLSLSTAGGKADYDTWSWAGSDGLHPNDAGHAAIATGLYSSMRSLGVL